MKMTIVARKIELTDALRSSVEKKFARLDRYFHEDADAKVTLTVEKNSQEVEATVVSNGTIFRVSERTNDMYVSLDKAIDSFERQFRKHKTRLEKRLRSGAFDLPADADIGEIEEETEFRIVKKKSFITKPMSPEEAVLQMNLLGHSFYLFLDSDTERTALVYKRKDGDYGLIEIQ